MASRSVPNVRLSMVNRPCCWWWWEIEMMWAALELVAVQWVSFRSVSENIMVVGSSLKSIAIAVLYEERYCDKTNMNSIVIVFLLRTLSFTLTLRVHLTILISVCWSGTSFSFLTGQISLLCSVLLRTQVLYSLPLLINDISLLVSNGTNCPSYQFMSVWPTVSKFISPVRKYTIISNLSAVSLVWQIDRHLFSGLFSRKTWISQHQKG